MIHVTSAHSLLVRTSHMASVSPQGRDGGRKGSPTVCPGWRGHQKGKWHHRSVFEEFGGVVMSL